MVAGYIQAMLWAQIKHFSFTFWSLEITELRSLFLTSLHKQRKIEEIEHTVFRKDWSPKVFLCLCFFNYLSENLQKLKDFRYAYSNPNNVFLYVPAFGRQDVII